MNQALAIARILESGKDDWVHFPELLHAMGEASRLCQADDNLETGDPALQIIWLLICSGLMKAGDMPRVAPENSKKPQRLIAIAGSPAEVVAEIRRRWSGLSEVPSLGDVCWFENTELGDTVAAAIESSGERLWDETAFD